MESYKNIIIVGAGVFGISTAIALAKRYPSLKVHVIDRYEPPVADATSVDTTRCIQVDYKDKVYYKLATKSMELIKNDPIISQHFHQSGMTFVYDGKPDHWQKYYSEGMESAKEINKGKANMVISYDTSDEVFKRIHGANSIPTNEKSLGRETWWNKGYTNLADGFIDAELALKSYYERAQTYNNIEFTFDEVTHLDYHSQSKKAKGVSLKSGKDLSADLVIVAAGAWSCKLVDLEDVSESSAIEVSWIKVGADLEEKWKDMSITTNLSTGINIFPPFKGEIKVLRRSAGYKNSIEIERPRPLSHEKQTISYPRTKIDYPNDWIPDEAETELRRNLREIMPPISDKPFDRTKLCWLTQTTTSNFLVDYYPHAENVLMATGGSAHGWKFVPVFGDKVVDFMEGNLEQEIAEKWSWEEKLKPNTKAHAVRMPGRPQELKDAVRNIFSL